MDKSTEQRIEELEKKVAELEGRVPEQLDVRIKAQRALEEIGEGKSTFNEARVKIGLLPVNDKKFDVAITTAQFDNSMEQD